MPRGAGAPVRAAGALAVAGGRRRDVRVAMLTRPIAISPTIRVGSISDEATDQHSGTFLARQWAHHENSRCTAVGSTPAPTLSGRWGDSLPRLPHVDAPYGLGVPECGDELADEHAVLGHALGTARDLIALAGID